MSTIHTQFKKYRQSSLIEIMLYYTAGLFFLSLLLYMCLLLYPILHIIELNVNAICRELNNAANGVFHQ